MSDTTQYRPLKQELGDDQAPSTPSSPHPSWVRRGLIATVFTSLIASVLLNGILGIRHVRLRSQARLDFAGLARDSPISWTHHTLYTGAEDNQTEADALWDKISVDAGTVALSNSYASSKGLPEAQKFPWDGDKGLYLLNGYHSLHCLKKIRTAVREFHMGVSLTAPMYHIYHCLDALRLEVLCDADDTPRYTGMGQSKKASATHQIRSCKDWGRMEAWAIGNSACWRYFDEKSVPADTLDQFRFCPEGSPYATKIQEFFEKRDTASKESDLGKKQGGDLTEKARNSTIESPEPVESWL